LWFLPANKLQMCVKARTMGQQPATRNRSLEPFWAAEWTLIYWLWAISCQSPAQLSVLRRQICQRQRNTNTNTTADANADVSGWRASVEYGHADVDADFRWLCTESTWTGHAHKSMLKSNSNSSEPASRTEAVEMVSQGPGLLPPSLLVCLSCPRTRKLPLSIPHGPHLRPLTRGIAVMAVG